MIRVILFTILTISIYVLDSRLNSSFIITHQHKTEKNQFISFVCINSTFSPVTFEFQDPAPPQDKTKLIYSDQFGEENCSTIMKKVNSSDIDGIEEKYIENHHFRFDIHWDRVDYQTKTYFEATEVVMVKEYAIFGELPPLIYEHHKNRFKFLEDSIVTVIGFLSILIIVKNLPEENQDQFGTYLEESQLQILAVIVLISQPLRPLCFFREFETAEWLFGQLFYSVGEFTFLFYILQFQSFIRGYNNLHHRNRNIFLALVVMIPICYDRLLIAFKSYDTVLVNIDAQLQDIENVKLFCWWFFLMFSSVFLYEVIMSLQNQKSLEPLVMSVIFFISYAYQKSKFYIGKEKFDHHLFNPINMLTMITYLTLMITKSFEKQTKYFIDLNESNSQDNEVEMRKLQLDDEEQINNLENDIAEYYKD